MISAFKPGVFFICALIPAVAWCEDVSEVHSPCRAGWDTSEWPKTLTEFSLIDPRRKDSYESLLEQMLRGDVALDDLQLRGGWHESTLWILLNAVYARHGRPFQNPFLRQLFYTARCPAQELGQLCQRFPLKERKEFTDQDLTNVDNISIGLLRGALKRQCGY